MARDANRLNVTIIRPRAGEIPEKIRIGGLATLAKVIVKKIREEAQEERSGEDDAALADELGES